MYNFDSYKKKITSSLMGFTTFVGTGFYQSFELWFINEYEKYLQTYYEIQKQHVENRKKIKNAKNKLQQLIKEKGNNQKQSLIVELKDTYRQSIIEWAKTNATSHMDKLVNSTATFVINCTKTFYNIIKNYNNQNHRVAIPVIQTQNNIPHIAAQEDRSQ